MLLVFRRALYGGEYADAAVPSEMSHLLHMDLYRLMRTVEVLGEIIYWQRVRDKRRALYYGDPEKGVTKTDLLDVAKVLAPWPVGFREFLRAHYDDQLSIDASRQSFRDAFSWALYTLGKNLKEHAGQLAFLRDEVARFGAAYWTQDQLMRGARFRSSGSFEFRWGSVPDAAEVLGIDSRTLLRRIREGEVPVKETATLRKNRNYKVDLQWAKAQQYSAHPGVKIRLAAAMLGLSPPVLSMLQAKRTYRSTLMTRPPNTFAVEDVQRFKEKISELVAHLSTDGSLGGIEFCGRRLDKIRSAEERAHALHALIES